MARQSILNTEEKLEAVLTLLRKEDTGTKIARRFGISENSLYRYRERFLESGKSGLRNGTNTEQKRIQALEKDVAQREQLIGELTVANRILKKKAAGLI